MDFSYEVVEHIGILSEQKNGWKKELNLISWNGREPVYDIRTWNPDGSKMGKGVTISKEEMENYIRENKIPCPDSNRFSAPHVPLYLYACSGGSLQLSLSPRQVHLTLRRQIQPSLYTAEAPVGFEPTHSCLTGRRSSN